MRLALQIISWVMGIFGGIAVIDLIVQSSQGVTGNGAGIVVGFVWIVQSTLVLIYIKSGGTK